MQLTYTECKKIVNNGYNLRLVLDEFKNVPAWANLNSTYEIESIAVHGCEANAHISCFYYKAKKIYLEYSDRIEVYLGTQDLDLKFTFDIELEDINIFIARILMTAVELKAQELHRYFED